MYRKPGDGVHNVAKGDPRIEAALESDEHRLRHVERHKSQGAGKGDEPGSGREAEAHGKARVGIASRSESVGKEKAVEPGMDDPVARLEGDAFSLDHESRKVAVHPDIGRFGIGRRVAERLHEHFRLEFETGQFLEFVGGHGPGRVLGTHGRHLGFAGRAGKNALKAAGAADDLLSQRVSLA